MHFQQSPAWQSFQEALGRQTFQKSGKDWSFLAVLERGKGNTRLFCPYGPHAKDGSSFMEAIDELIVLAKATKVSFIRIEPEAPHFAELLKKRGWHKTAYQSHNPEHTRIIDLTQPKDQLISQMAQPVRNIYRNYHKKNVSVTKSTNPKDIEIFLELIHQVADRTGMNPHSDDYFRQQANSLLPTGKAQLWIAKIDGTPIATAITFDSSSTRYYAHAAASALPEHRRLNAGTALVAEAIIDAKKQGLDSFDLYGIAPDDAPPTHPWKGFTKFKTSFGGQNVSRGGTWELPARLLSYWTYRAYQTIRRQIISITRK